MAMVTGAALMIWFTLLVAADMPIGRSLYRWTVEAPARQLNRITRGHVVFVLLLVTGAGLVCWLIGHEAVRLIAMGLPDLLAMATMFEVTAYLDAVAAIVAAATATRFGPLTAWVRSIPLFRRARPRAPRRVRTTREAANDDSDRPVPLSMAA